MQSQYQLRQTVIVTLKEQTASSPINNQTVPMGRSTFFFGEIVAMNNGDKLYIRRLNSHSSVNADLTELLWIDINDERYHVAEARL